MIRILFSCFLFAILFSSCQNTDKPAEKEEAKRPNVILIMTDDQGYGDLACLGNEFIKTPNLDKLYSQSTSLTDFHVGTTCAPTRSALMTGKHFNKVGVWHTINGRSLLRKEEKTVANVFADAGYNTGIFGKWHLGDNYPFRPQDRGFQEVWVHGGGGVTQAPDYWGNDYFDDTYYHNGHPEKVEGYCTDVWFSKAIDFIDKNKDKPFFCYIPTNAPHGPLFVDEKYSEPYRGNENIPSPEFNGMITNIDENVGLLEAYLQKNNLADNTILIFMTDNGTANGVRLNGKGFAEKGFNANMRGKKGSNYEGGHRVPFFIRWPQGGLSKKAEITQNTIVTDVLPTLIDLCGIEVSKDLQFDGTSLKPLLYGNKAPWKDRMLMVDTQREYDLKKYKRPSVMFNEWRLVNGDELYNIAEDPAQATNVADQYPDRVVAMKAGYEELWEDVSVNKDEISRIVVGVQDENPLRLSSHDWAGTSSVPWNQGHVRSGVKLNGFWNLTVAEAGEYEISLCRWPRSFFKTLRWGDPNNEAGNFKPINIQTAKLKIGENELSKPISERDKEAKFNVSLRSGETTLQTWFDDGTPDTFGAYYVYITKV
ncbi:arylsulfatase [Reichenbachiella sp. MALMAid0571]|uniref:arylsulfatase n=1 Tax=Reichenbachiella sp. MALMAid0571 TaxID=3143939 RepID=UPI0032DE69B0